MVAVLTGVFTKIGLGATAAGIAANITGSVLLSLAQRALVGRPKPVDPGADIQTDSSLPSVRHAYGRSRIPGTWVPGAEVAPPYLYGFYLLNSRPSDGIEKILLDDVELTWTGDPRDWSEGAIATNSQHAGFVKFWITLGDRIGPPDQIMSEYGDATGTDPALFWPSDRFEGLTGIWFRLDRGPAASVGSRWPRNRPEVQAEGRWSRVWDPREAGQDADDPDTWTWSENHGLCLLDFLRFNPISRYPLDLIRLSGGLGRQIDLSDETVDGAPRYRVGGVIDFDGIQDISALVPVIEDPGGGWLVDVGGQVDYRPGEYIAPQITLSVPLADQPIEFEAWGDAASLPRGVRAEFPNPAQNWERSTLLPAAVPGGGGLDGTEDRIRTLALPLVPFANQAMRLQKIRAQVLGSQRRLSLAAPPAFAGVVSGAVFEAEFPRATDRRNGEYMIVRMRTANSFDTSDGTVLSIPTEGIETGPHIWAWNLATDGQDVGEAVITPPSLAMAPPSDLAASGTVIGGLPAIDFSFLPSPDSGVTGYVWEWRVTGGDWKSGGVLTGDTLTAGRVTGQLVGLAVDTDHDIRVRARGAGRESDWVTVTAVNSGLGGETPPVSLDDLGVVGDGVADDGPAINAALAWAQGRPLVGRPGAVYRLATAVSYTGNWRLDLSRSRWFADANVVAFRARGTLAGFYALTANYTAGALVLDVDTMPAALAEGTVIKIVSDAVDPGNRDRGSAAGQHRVGEHAVVGAGSTTTQIVLRKALEFTTGIDPVSDPDPGDDEPRIAAYTTAMNARVIVYASEVCEIDFGRGGYRTGESWAQTAMIVEGFVRPRLRHQVDYGYSIALAVNGCFEPEVTKAVADKLENDLGAGQFGYVVQDLACTGGRYSGLSAGDTRSLWTCSSRIPATSDTDLYNWIAVGRTVGALVDAPRGIGPGNRADTHHNAERVTFRNVYLDGGNGVQVRGHADHIAPVVLNAAEFAYTVQTEGGSVSQPEDDTYLAGNERGDLSACVTTDARLEGPQAYRVLRGFGTLSGNSTLRSSTSTAVQVLQGELTIAGPTTIIASGAGTAASGVVSLETGESTKIAIPIPVPRITIDAPLRIDARAAGASEVRALRAEAGCEVVIRNRVDITLPAGGVLLSSAGDFRCEGAGEIVFEVIGAADDSITTNIGTRPIRVRSADGSVRFDGVDGPERALFSASAVLDQEGTGAMVGNFYIPPAQGFAPTMASDGAGRLRFVASGRKYGASGVAQLGLYGPGTGTGASGVVAVLALPNTAADVLWRLEWEVTFLPGGAQQYWHRLIATEVGGATTTTEAHVPEAFTITAHALRLGARCETSAFIAIDQADVFGRRG